MDFFDNQDAPVAIRIAGVEYRLPLFLNDDHTAWSAGQRKAIADEATAHLKPDEKARFLIYTPVPLIDISESLLNCTTSAGAKYVCEAQMKAAGVPENHRAIVLKSNPAMLRTLADKLTRAQEGLNLLGVDREEEKADPTKRRPPASGGSPETGPQTSAGSSTPTTDATPESSPPPAT